MKDLAIYKRAHALLFKMLSFYEKHSSEKLTQRDYALIDNINAALHVVYLEEVICDE